MLYPTSLYWFVPKLTPIFRLVPSGNAIAKWLKLPELVVALSVVVLNSPMDALTPAPKTVKSILAYEAGLAGVNAPLLICETEAPPIA